MTDKIDGREADLARLANIKYRMDKGEPISVEDANFFHANSGLLEESGNTSKYDFATYQQDKQNIDLATPISKGEFIAAMDHLGKIIESKFIQFDNKFTTMVNNSAVNNQVAVQTGNGQQSQQPSQKSEMLHGLIETAVDYLKSSRQQSGPSEFESELLARSKAEMMESVNIVSLINKKVKSALVSDIAGGVADNIMKSTQANLQAHEHGF